MYKYKNTEKQTIAYTLHNPTQNYPLNGVWLHIAILFILAYALPIMISTI